MTRSTRTPAARWAVAALFAALLSASGAAQAVRQVAPRASQAPAGPPARLDHPLSSLPAVWAQSGLGPVELDRSVGGPLAGDGGALRVNGRTFSHGYGVAATGVIVHDLGGVASWFSSWVGVDDEVGNAGSVVFLVLADGALRYQSPVLRGADFAAHTGRIDVTGVRELMLVVLDAGDGQTSDHGVFGEPTVYAHVPPIGDGVALRAQRGFWEAPLAWPVSAMHATLFPNGRLVTHASRLPQAPGTDAPSDPHSSTRVDVADIATWSHTASDHPSFDLYSAGHARLARGGLLAVGGHAGRASNGRPLGGSQASRFGSALAGWLPQPALPEPRAGASALTLGDGSVLALGGANLAGSAGAPLAFDGLAWRRLSGVTTAGLFAVGEPRADDQFPLLHLAPDGRVLVAGWGTSLALLDTVGRGAFDVLAPREPVRRAFGSAAPLGAGALLVTGGADSAGSGAVGQRSAVRVDVTGPAPSVSAVAPMLFPRVDHDATVLADGSVLVSGGATVHVEGENPRAVRVPERYDPTTGRWEQLAAARIARGYRSTALLLPDGRVWTGGGEGAASAASAEVFQPPYLFRPDGTPAPRPAIVAAPTRADYGAVFTVQLAAPTVISRATFVRMGSATHGVNTDQRCLPLTFSQVGNVLQVTAPADGYIAPPGPYMLFVFDALGAPSVAATIELALPSDTQWVTAPSSDGSAPTARHEASMVEVGGKLYLLGGRGFRPVEEYDPVVRRWRSLGFPPVLFHHFQPVVVDGLVYVLGAMADDNYPNEANLDRIYTWEPQGNVWTPGPFVPVGRRRGGAGAVVYEGRIYLVAGNSLGHNGGARPWFDVYDPSTQQWSVLPDAPRARDHFLAVVVGNKLVLAGGRRSTQPNVFANTVPEVDVYEFGAGAWATLAAPIPTRRAGTLAVGVGRHVVVLGGESDTQVVAHDQVEALDVLTGEWLSLPRFVTGRHSGGAGVVDGRLYVASGAGNAGGWPELSSVERLDINRALNVPSANLVVNGGFDLGLVGWVDQGDLELVAAGGVAAPGLRVGAGRATRTLPGVPGTLYRLSALVRVDAGAGTARVGLEALDGGGVLLGQQFAALAPTTTLRSVGATLTAPPGTAQVRIVIEASGARTVVVDDVVVVD